jgi:2-dehydropantoate 2-reductase
MKIYVIGVGGVGGYFGGLLAKAGMDITFVARSGQDQAMQKYGLIVKSAAGDFMINPVRVIDDISKMSSPNLVLVCVKTYDTATVAKQLAGVVSRSLVITFQNGVENDLEIKKYLPSALVFPGVAYVISRKTKPGVIEQTGGLRKLIFGDRNGTYQEELREIESFMKKTGINAELSQDITIELWQKFVFIIPFSGLTTCYRKSIGEILMNVNTKQEYEQSLREVITVAHACGVQLPNNTFESTMTLSQKTAPNSKSSLLVDIESGYKTELETLHGALVRLAKEKGIPVPKNEQIYHAIRSVSRA